MPPKSHGFRGALLLAEGRYHVQGQLHLRVSGVVLRGTDPQKTVIVAEGIDRRSLIEVGASKDPALDKARNVTEDAPAGAMTLTLDNVEGLATGDHAVVRRPSTEEWISAMSMSG
ncbi:MAG TPA: hypothetical protein VHW70_05360, partial [Edaphobacter sp.]|nr:hypothetical protein [Edaphobacter sp.]